MTFVHHHTAKDDNEFNYSKICYNVNTDKKQIMWEKLKSFWGGYETRIMLCIGLILVAIISFEFGYVQGKNQKTDVMIIEKPMQELKTSLKDENSATMVSREEISQGKNLASENPIIDQNKCAYVGSKNSDKFYPPNCSYAKRIKTENIICFSSAQEAISQGRTESIGCAK